MSTEPIWKGPGILPSTVEMVHCFMPEVEHVALCGWYPPRSIHTYAPSKGEYQCVECAILLNARKKLTETETMHDISPPPLPPTPPARQKQEEPLTASETFWFREMKRHLEAGATIKAMDPKRVLVPLGKRGVYAGLHIVYPDDVTARAESVFVRQPD